MAVRGRIGPWCSLAVAAGVVGMALATSASAARTPLDGSGMWIWYVSHSGGSAGAIAEQARKHRLRTVLIKSSDGASAWSQFTPRLVSNLHRRGMRVCAWQFVYGNSPVAEARRGAEAVADGADCLAIDAESSYEGRYRSADRYIRELRDRIGHRYPLALTSFPYVDYHPALPYSVFLGRGGATLNVPQVYWRAIGDSVTTSLRHTYRWNRPYHRPIYPLGQTYQDPPREQLRRFRRLTTGYGARGVSWWSWQETGGREWNAIGRRIHGPYPHPKRTFPSLAQGSRGDTVVLLQELLRAAGQKVGITGIFGDGTARAVRRFQNGDGIDPSGNAKAATWRALRRFRPARVNWKRKGNPAHVRVRLAPALPPALELPSTPGRP
ncbi:MAG: peptidoglycan-binding domain-containing protein [bacterium]